MKKAIIIALFITTLIFSGCSSNKMGTFEEEMKKKQESYVENVNKHFSYIDYFSGGKYSGSGDLSVFYSIDGLGDFDFSVKNDTKFIVEPKKFAYDGEIDFSFFFKFADKLSSFLNDYDNLSEEILASTELNTKLETKLGFLDNNLYFTMKNFDFEISNPNNNETLNAFELINFDYFDKKLGNKWLKYDLSGMLKEGSYEELFKLLSENKEKISNFVSENKNLLGQVFSGDIFVSDGILTEYEGKKAYKFTIDEKKMEEHLKSLARTFLTNNKEILKMNDDEIEETISKIGSEDRAKNYELKSEGYLVENSGGDVDFILKVSLIEENDKLNIEILPNKVNFAIDSLNNERNKMSSLISFNFEKDGNIKFNWKQSYDNEEYYSYNFDISGNFKIVKEGNTFKIVFNFDMPFITDELKDTIGIDKMDFKFSVSQFLNKDDSIEITEKSILGDLKALTPEEYIELLDKTFLGAFSTYNNYINEKIGNNNLDNDGFVDEL